MNLFSQEEVLHMIEHMNKDHVEAMHDYCDFYSIETHQVDPVMVEIDQHGFAIQIKEKIYRIKFPAECHSTTEVRQALVEMAKLARNRA